MAAGGQQRQRPGRRGPQRPSMQPPSVLSNLQSLLLHTAPTLPLYSDPDSPSSRSASFTLADLWQSYEAWSAYGCEVPLRINVDGVWQEVIQCYTPHLAGIQLFAADPRYGADHARRIPTSTSSATASGYCSEEEEGAEGGEAAPAGSSARSDTCSSAYTCSTASTASTASDSEDGDEACCKGSPLAGSGAPAGLHRLAAAAGAGGASARGSVLQKQHALGEPSVPVFEYMEGERPHLRLPLHDQILELAERCPELLTLDTRDLHPTSWLAVTWVPIYRIPSVPDPAASRDLQANFLTFHSLTVPAPRTHAAPADLCSIAPLPPLLDPIGAAAVAWRTEVARQQLLAAALQQFAAAQQAAAAGSAPAACDAAAPASQPASPSGSAAGESAGSSPVATVAARLAASSLECGAAPSMALRPQLPLAATCLRPFAFMPYKAAGRTWVDDWNLQRQHLPMIAAAGSWVERRKVPLPDFDWYSHCYRPLPTGFSSGGYQR